MKKNLLVLGLSSLTAITYAEVNLSIQERDPMQTSIDTKPPIKEPLEKDLKYHALSSEKNNDNVVRYTGKQLRENPEILEKLFLDALIIQNTNVLPTYIKLYQVTQNPDYSLIEWANAILMKKENISESVSLYRKLISSFPDNNFIRFQLADSLFFNQEYVAAKEQFEKLRAGENVTKQDIFVFEQYLNAINNKNKWNISFGATFLNDPNLGNSAEKGTTVVLPNGRVLTYDTEQESGRGISTWVGVDKQWGLSGGKYLVTNFNTSSKYYWNNKKYNDVNAYLDFGWGYSNPYFNFEFTPYATQRWYGGGLNGSNSLKRYMNTYGAELSTSYWITQKFKYGFNYNYGYEKYDKVRQGELYDGQLHQLSNSFTYIYSPKQYWNISFDFVKKKAKDKTNAYNRFGSRITWGQEWSLGISSSLTLGYAQRKYNEAFIFGVKQKNNEYSASISLWHKNIHYAGFTPRITYSYSKTSSNIPIYSYDKSQIFIDVSRTF